MKNINRLGAAGVARIPQRARTPIFVYCVLLLSYLINAMDRQLFSILAVDVRTQLDLSLAQIGFAATVFTLGIGVAGVPTSFLFKKMPRKYVSIFGLALFSAATFLTAYSLGYPDLLIYRFVSGLGESIQLIAILSIGTSYFHANKAVAAGAVNATFGLGAIVGPNLGVVLLKSYSWQTPFLVFGIAGVFMLAACVLFIDKEFSEAKAPIPPGINPNLHTRTMASTTSTTWLLVAATILAGLVIYGYLGLYPTYLRSTLGFTPAQAAFASSCYGAGSLLSMLGGWLGDRFEYRRVLKAAFCVMALCGGAIFTPLGNSVLLHALLSFVLGCAASGVLFANLTTGIIRSIHPSMGSSFGASLYVAAFYIPASFAGYTLAILRGWVGWTMGGVIQLVGCSVAALILVSLTGAPKFRKPNLANAEFEAEPQIGAAQVH